MYKPRRDSFPHRTLQHLKQHGESKNEVIRESIGLNEYSKYSIYVDRSQYSFMRIVHRLLNHGVIRRTRKGYYELTKKGRKIQL